MQPTTIYGICKVTGELLGNYYHHKYGVDTRSVRFPGIISSVTLPGGGTTDYAVEIYYEAIRSGKFTCPVPSDVYMDKMCIRDSCRSDRRPVRRRCRCPCRFRRSAGSVPAPALRTEMCIRDRGCR